jgi:hypothetical protein
MGRLWSCGFELQSVTAGVEWQTTIGSPTINTTTKASGDAALRCNPTAAAHYIQHTFRGDVVADVWGRFKLYIATAPSAKTTILAYGDSGNFYGAKIRLGTDSKLYTNNSALTTETAGSTVLTTGQWYSITWYYNETTNTLTVKVDGVTEINAASVDDIAGGGRIRQGIFEATTADLYFDDIALNDNSGTVENSYPDYRGKLVIGSPDGAGDNAGFTLGAGTGSNFQLVDEIPPNDATDYVQKTTTGTVIDDHTVESSTSMGIGSSDTIVMVEVGIRGGSTATTAGATISPRLKSAASGTVSTGAAGAFNVNGWRTNGAAAPLPLLISYTDPTTGIAWTPTGTNSIDSMQIGYTNAASNTTVRRVSAVYAQVEYIPASGSSFSQTPSDSTTVSESVGKRLVKNVSDSSTVTESASQSLNGGAASYSRTPTDSTTVTEAVGKNFVKKVSDSTTISESASPVLTPGGSFTGDALVVTVNDDAGEINNTGAVSLTTATHVLSSTSVNYGKLGFRFTSVNVRQGATVRAARLRIRLSSVSTSTGATFSIYGQAADNAAAFSTTASDISSRALTTANTSSPYDRTDDIPDGYYEIDITGVIQEIINRAGWTANNALALIINSPGSSLVGSFDMTESGNPAQLHLVYDTDENAYSPSATEAVDAAWTNIGNIFASDDSRALGTDVFNTGKSFVAKGFGISLTGRTIKGIEVTVEGLNSSASNDSRCLVELSWDGGTSWSSQLSTMEFDTVDNSFKVGATLTSWGHTFTTAELSDTNFRVRITPVNSTSTNDMSIDYVGVKIFSVSSGGSATYSQTPSDSSTPAESVAKFFVKRVSDSSSIAESASKAVTTVKTDSTTPTEASAKNIVVSKSDSTVPTESAVKSYGLLRSDSSAPTESVVKRPILNKADSTTPSESAAKAFQANRSDSSASSESVTKAVRLNKTDAATISEQFSKVVQFVRAVSDSAAIVEAVSKSTKKNLADSATISEFALQAIIIILMVSDSTTILESVVKSVGKTVQDSSAPADSTIKAFGKKAADSSTTTESASMRAVKNPTDSSTSSDSVSKSYGKRPVDSTAPTDSIAKAIIKTLSDLAVEIESVVKSVVKSPVDLATLIEYAEKTFTKSASDTATTSEVMLKQVTKLIQDGTLTDDQVMKAFKLVVGDVGNVTEEALINLRYVSNHFRRLGQQLRQQPHIVAMQQRDGRAIVADHQRQVHLPTKNTKAILK